MEPSKWNWNPSYLDSLSSDGRSKNLLPLTVVILDADGKIIVSKNVVCSDIVWLDIAYKKALDTFGMGICGRLIWDFQSIRLQFFTVLAAVVDGGFVPVPSGVLIEDAGGLTISTVGISGDNSEKDE